MVACPAGDDLVFQFSGATIQKFLAWLMNGYQDKPTRG